MEAFTYEDYIYYRRTLKEYKGNMLSDVKDEYIYNKEEREITKPHDKIFKEILEDKEEAVKFINENLKIENTENEIKKEEIEKYNREFIGEDFRKIESDIIYKKKGENIFFLIEHQSSIDYGMAYRILKYNMAIIDSAIEKEKVRNKNYKLPVVYTFVIYTGKRKWNVEKYIEEKQEGIKGRKKEKFGKYEIIDINKYSKKELLKSKMLLPKVMLLEKAKNIEEVEEYIEEIIKGKVNEKQKDFIIRVVKYILKGKMSKEKYEEINKKLKKKESEKVMFVQIISDWVDEMLEKENILEEKEEWLEERKEELEEKKEKLEEKEEKLEEKEEKLEEKLEEKEAKIEEKETKIKQKLINKEEELRNVKIELIISALKMGMNDEYIMNTLKISKEELEKIKNETIL